MVGQAHGIGRVLPAAGGGRGRGYPGAKGAEPGLLGGQAACTPAHPSGQGVSMCVWFDNDTFGTLVSPTMTSAELAALLVKVRPGIEQSATR